MSEHQVSRTLVKSGPELWAECSDAASLARHLGSFGEIRITKLEPETAVAWEGEDVSGTVTLEPSGWGTRVILTAAGAPSGESEPKQAIPAAEVEQVGTRVQSVDAVQEGAAAEEERAVTEPERAAEAGLRPGMLARLLGRFRARPAVAIELDPPQHAAPAPISPPADPLPTRARIRLEAEADETRAPEAVALASALDSLGTAHRRPFSRN